MQLSDFHFDLPAELIAQYPLPERSASRLLHLDRESGAITHQQFTDIVQRVKPGDLLVFNNTRVLPARLFASKTTGGKVEILLERIVDEAHILAHVKASKACPVGCELRIADDAVLRVVGRSEQFYVLERVSTQPWLDLLKAHGHMPLPPYMQREAQSSDDTRYQTVYATTPGAVAAPTAGLHFDEALLAQLKENGVEFAFVTLHVGSGTFLPVRVQDVATHVMHAEQIEITQAVVDQIQATRARGGRVIAVGTTSVRVLESAAQGGAINPYSGDTRIFIYPGFTFNVVDALITNFHLPESTLMFLVSALAGRDRILAAYQEAIAQQYRFFSYGDAMFIE